MLNILFRSKIQYTDQFCNYSKLLSFHGQGFWLCQCKYNQCWTGRAIKKCGKRLISTCRSLEVYHQSIWAYELYPLECFFGSVINDCIRNENPVLSIIYLIIYLIWLYIKPASYSCKHHEPPAPSFSLWHHP